MNMDTSNTLKRLKTSEKSSLPTSKQKDKNRKRKDAKSKTKSALGKKVESSQKNNLSHSTRVNVDDLKKRNVKKKVAKPRKKSQLTNDIKMHENPDYSFNDVKCQDCDQKLNDVKLFDEKNFEGKEEAVAIFDNSLQVSCENLEDSRPFNKLTDFSIYCKNLHLCRIDLGIIEKDVEVKFSGYLQPIDFDNCADSNNVSVKNCEVLAWSTEHFNDENPVIVLQTEFGDYALMKPSEKYVPFMQPVLSMFFVIKIITEYLNSNPHAIFEEILFKVMNYELPVYASYLKLGEGDLISNAGFIYEHLVNVYNEENPDDLAFILAPGIMRLMNLACIDPFDLYKKTFTAKKKKLDTNQLIAPAKKLEKNSFIEDLLPNFEILLKDGYKRCGDCYNCLKQSCEECSACTNGHPVKCVTKTCMFGKMQEKYALDNFYRDSGEAMEASRFLMHPQNYQHSEKPIKFNAEPVSNLNKRTFYASVEINGQTYSVNDYAKVGWTSKDENVTNYSVFRLVSIYKDEDKENAAEKCHVHCLMPATDTILGDLADKRELVCIDYCTDLNLTSLDSIVSVEVRDIPHGWMESVQDSRKLNDIQKDYYLQRAYNPKNGSFCNLSEIQRNPQWDKLKFNMCSMCESNNEKPVGCYLKDQDTKECIGKYMNFKEVKYWIGNFVYLKPRSLCHMYPQLKKNDCIDEEKRLDPVTYPEYHRKSSVIPVEGGAPFDIGFITDLFFKNNVPHIKVRKMYRPENTHREEAASLDGCSNFLLWSDKETSVPFSFVVDKCFVEHKKCLDLPDEWILGGPDRFIFYQTYDKKYNKFFECDKKKWFPAAGKNDIPHDYPKIEKLKTLNLFGQIGGMALGLTQSGAAEICWAIEKDETSALIYKINHPATSVYINYSFLLLEEITKGNTTYAKQNLPKKGDVEFICGSVPWSDEIERDNFTCFKNSAISTFIGYCNYYRPEYFLLEAEDKLAKREDILKFTLACFLNMGYQINFGVLQIACYGAPQNLKRTVIIGAAPGKLLPTLPKPLHALSSDLKSSDVIINNIKYSMAEQWPESAPLKMVTVRDAIYDLPPITSGNNTDRIEYKGNPKSPYQKFMRQSMEQPILDHHVCPNFGPEVQKRLELLQQNKPGVDWRDLPNKEVELSNKKCTETLEYTYQKVGDETISTLVCNCGNGVNSEVSLKPDASDPSSKMKDGVKDEKNSTDEDSERNKTTNDEELKDSCDKATLSSDEAWANCRAPQDPTTMSWHLAHKAKLRPNETEVSYARLHWDGLFPGGIITPAPINQKQLAVIHPVQARVISQRELARAQGFPDDYKFGNYCYNRYVYIGSSSSPFLAKAIGREIAKSISPKISLD